MPAAVTARCSRCGHEPTHLAKPYAAWRLAIRRGPAWQGLVVVVYNLLVAVFVPRRPVCTWCHARRTPRAQRSYGFDPFVHYTRHSREAMVLRRRAAALRPHPSTGRWDPGDRAEILAYLASRDEGRCGLCALPLPVAEGQVEHVRSQEVRPVRLLRGLRPRRANARIDVASRRQPANGPRLLQQGQGEHALRRQVASSHAASAACRTAGRQPAHLPLGARERSRPCDAGGAHPCRHLGVSVAGRGDSETGFRHQARDPRRALRPQRAACSLGPELWAAERHSLRRGLDALLGVGLWCCRLASRSAQTSGSRSEIEPRVTSWRRRREMSDVATWLVSRLPAFN